MVSSDKDSYLPVVKCALVTMHSCKYCGERASIVETPAAHPDINSDELPEIVYECRIGHLWARSDVT